MLTDLPPLPYPKGALSPHLSAETLEFHYERHHRGYLDKLRGLVAGTHHEASDLVVLMLEGQGAIRNNAAQVWNHSFYWNSMSPEGGGEPTGDIAEAIRSSFGSLASFEKEFSDCGVGLFGSGYVWLAHDPDTDRLVIEAGKDAANPLEIGRTPLLTADVWEHAYYLDHRNERNRYLESFLGHLANWQFAEDSLKQARRA